MADLNEIERRVVALERTLALKSNLAAEQAGIEDPSIPSVQSLMKLAEVQTDFQTEVVLQFAEPEDFPDVAGYEIWITGLTGTSLAPYKVGEVASSPARFLVSAKTTGIATGTVRTVMNNGRKSDLGSTPSFAIEITQPSLSAASIADGSIGDAKLDRTTDPITIVNADIANLAVTNAKIADLAATKITAGTLAAGVIYANAIQAAQIQAGTIASVNVSAGTYSLISGNEQMLIDGVNGYRQLNSSTGKTIQMLNGRFISTNANTASILRTIIDSAAAAFITNNAGGVEAERWEISNGTIVGQISGTTVVIFSPFADGGGSVGVNNLSGASRARLRVDANDQAELNLAGYVEFDELSSTPANPTQDSQAHLYVKANKLIAQWNDGGTVRYKYLDLTGTGVTWVHTTSAP